MSANLKVENVTVQVDQFGALGARLGTCVAGDVNGTHYHVWINATTLEHSAALYQHLKSAATKPTSSSVRTLDAEFPRNARVVAALLAAVRDQDLIAKGRAAAKVERHARNTERQERERAARAHEALAGAAPALLAAAKVIALTPHIVSYLEHEDPKALAQIRAAIAITEVA